ncbi:hypothetical protein KUCAC02_029882 [Chaenocephalus aceratus]|uniref:Uncharacterized protein n=1 Tax=Chaenocephalus aceratus TaxID=36190 RepID=A0ACB9XH51_CHAAC|nr:hypothetical protein KUCAC02_029882 [Chaenocephalus aceratus]
MMKMLLARSLCLLLLLSCLSEPVESRTLNLNSCSVSVHTTELRTHYTDIRSNAPQQQRHTSALANSFVSIRREIHACHCQCVEDTQRKIDTVHAEFIKLEISQAAKKAVGELDTVLEWMEGLVLKTRA